MKRLLDLVVAGSMLVLALPLFVPIIAVLAVTGEREIFYRQLRIGRRGAAFPLLKFATMVKNSASMGTGTVTVANDPRVLPVGRFLRKTKLNELPQLLNVLRGEMSLVGPRPLARQDFDVYPADVQAEVVRVRPGLTGMGSVVFRDEESVLASSALPPLEAYAREIAPRKGALECWYVRNSSLSLDLRILVATAIVVLMPRSRLYERLLPQLEAIDVPAQAPPSPPASA